MQRVWVWKIWLWKEGKYNAITKKGIGICLQVRGKINKYKQLSRVRKKYILTFRFGNGDIINILLTHSFP